MLEFLDFPKKNFKTSGNNCGNFREILRKFSNIFLRIYNFFKKFVFVPQIFCEILSSFLIIFSKYWLALVYSYEISSHDHAFFITWEFFRNGPNTQWRCRVYWWGLWEEAKFLQFYTFLCKIFINFLKISLNFLEIYTQNFDKIYVKFLQILLIHQKFPNFL